MGRSALVKRIYFAVFPKQVDLAPILETLRKGGWLDKLRSV